MLAMTPSAAREPSMFVVTEECTFPATHRVKMADGEWEPYHEHQWLLKVHVRAARLDPDGFVVDFLDLQAAMKDAIAPYVGKVFNDTPPFLDAPHENSSLIPTAECIAWQLYRKMAPQIDDRRVQLFRVSLREAPTSWGIFEAEHTPPMQGP